MLFNLFALSGPIGLPGHVVREATNETDNYLATVTSPEGGLGRVLPLGVAACRGCG